MKIQEFVEQRKETWELLVRFLNRIDRESLKSLRAEELREVGQLYRQVSSDLAHAKTYFPTSEVTRFLNDIVARSHNRVYIVEKVTAGNISRFFVRDFPALFRSTQKYFLTSAALFIGAALFAFVICSVDEKAASFVVPEELIEDYIRQGRMWTEDRFAVSPAPVTTSFIARNNITVTFLAFAFGITFGSLTIYILTLNGYLFGALVALVGTYGMAEEFWSFVLPHGVVELSVIFIAGGAGLLIADALVNPGDYRRRDALKLNGRKAIKATTWGRRAMRK